MTLKTIIVGTDGTLRFIYDDATAALLAPLGGHTPPRRASHVEPCPLHGESDRWRADMSPVGGPILPMLDPTELAVTYDEHCYGSRAAALAAEESWLIAHNIPLPERS